MKEVIGTKKRDAYYSILSKIILYEKEDLQIDLINFYLRDSS